MKQKKIETTVRALSTLKQVTVTAANTSSVVVATLSQTVSLSFIHSLTFLAITIPGNTFEPTMLFVWSTFAFWINLSFFFSFFYIFCKALHTFLLFSPLLSPQQQQPKTKPSSLTIFPSCYYFSPPLLERARHDRQDRTGQWRLVWRQSGCLMMHKFKHRSWQVTSWALVSEHSLSFLGAQNGNSSCSCCCIFYRCSKLTQNKPSDTFWCWVNKQKQMCSDFSLDQTEKNIFGGWQMQTSRTSNHCTFSNFFSFSTWLLDGDTLQLWLNFPACFFRRSTFSLAFL